jgi:hypothetical protein
MSSARLAALQILAILAGSSPVLAEVPTGATAAACDDHAEVARLLGAKYQEAPVSLGLQSNGYLLEVFSSRQTGTWTIVSVAPDGEACVVAAGEHWETMAGGLPGSAT